MCEDFGFTLEIDLGVDVGGVDGNVSEPCADGVDIDASAEQVRRGCMSDSVWANRSSHQ